MASTTRVPRTCKNTDTGWEEHSKDGLEALFGPVRPICCCELWPHVLLQGLPRKSRVLDVALWMREWRHDCKRDKDGEG